MKNLESKKPPENPVLETLIKNLRKLKKEGGFNLHQDTEDQAQLDPIERIKSIQKVLEVFLNRFGGKKFETVIDAGSGFLYGITVLHSLGIKVVGVENVEHKVKQGLDLLKKAEFEKIKQIEKIDFSKEPSVVLSDFNSLEIEEKDRVDLISMFYVSLTMLNEAKTWSTLSRLLKQDGKILISTQANKKQVEDMIIQFRKAPFLVPFDFEIIEVPNNFEKTMIILSPKLIIR
jgi:tRNA A58 N-methylase Trm61